MWFWRDHQSSHPSKRKWPLGSLQGASSQPLGHSLLLCSALFCLLLASADAWGRKKGRFVSNLVSRGWSKTSVFPKKAETVCIRAGSVKSNLSSSVCCWDGGWFPSYHHLTFWPFLWSRGKPTLCQVALVPKVATEWPRAGHGDTRCQSHSA